MAANTPELIYLSVSPFSWRAKWALDSQGIEYTITKYNVAPFYVLELPLRWRLGLLTGVITAPIMLLVREGGSRQTIMDSTEIARWAAAHAKPGQASCSLFPESHAAEMERWLAATGQLLSMFRRELAAVGRAHPAVGDTMLPPGLSGMALSAARFMIAGAFRMLSTKYKEQDAGAAHDKVLEGVRAARQQLAVSRSSASPDAFLIPDAGLTYADIALATALIKVNELNTSTVPADAVDAAARQRAAQQSAAGPAAPTAADKGPAAGAAVAAAGGAESRVPVAALCQPQLQEVLKEAAPLVEWAVALMEKHWPQGKSGKRAVHKPAA